MTAVAEETMGQALTINTTNLDFDKLETALTQAEFTMPLSSPILQAGWLILRAAYEACLYEPSDESAAAAVGASDEEVNDDGQDESTSARDS